MRFGMPRWILFTLLTLLLWGGWGLVSKPLANALSPWQVQTFSTLGLLPIIAVLVKGRKLPTHANSRRGFCLAFGAGLLSSLGNVAYYQALAAGGKAAIVTPLASLYSLVTIPLAVVLLRERISGREGLGIALAILAAGALAWESPAPETPIPPAQR